MRAVQAREGGAAGFWAPVRRDEGLRAAALGVLDRVGLALRADDPVSALSHGERRLLEVALALALRPKLLLLDEPMAGLGPEGTKRSEERPVGKECVSTCRSRWAQYHYKKKNELSQPQQ